MLAGDRVDGSDREMELKDHLVELFVRIRRIAVVVAILSFVVSAIPVETETYVPLISVLPQRIIDHAVPEVVSWRGQTFEVKIAQYNPFGAFNILLKTALLLGFLAASPYIAYELYSYAAPGLTGEEKRKLKLMAGVALGLFAVGAVAAYLFVIPLAFRVMIIFSVAVVGDRYLVAFSDVERLFSTVILLVVATGLAFEAPLIVYMLVYHGVISPDWFKGENRKIVFIASLALGAVVSPDPSGMGMLVIGTSMYLAIIAAARLAEKHAAHRRGSQPTMTGEPGPPAGGEVEAPQVTP